MVRAKVDFDAGITNRADGDGECDAWQQREVHVNVEPLGLATRKSVRDGLKLLAHGVPVVQVFFQAEVTEVVRADLVTQERGKLFVLLEERIFPVGPVDMMAVLDLLDDLRQAIWTRYGSQLQPLLQHFQEHAPRHDGDGPCDDPSF